MGDIDNKLESRQPALPSDAMRYLDLYFTTTHTWLPMVDRYRLSSFVKQYSGNQAPPIPSAHEWSVLCLTWAIIAQVEAQSLQVIGAEHNNAPFIPTALETARSLIPREDAPVLQVEYVQALILLSLTQFSRHAWKSSWILITLAGRSGLSSEQPSRWWHDRPLASTQLRTFLACTAVETFLSLCLGFTPETSNFHPYHSSGATGSSIVEVEEIGWEEWGSYDDSSSSGPATTEPWRAMSAFNRMANLTQMMSKWISINYRGLSSLEKSRAYLSARQDLLDWRSKTDYNYPHLILDCSRITPRHVLLLELAYWAQHCILDVRFGGETVNGNAKSLQATKVEELAHVYRQQHGLATGSVVLFSALATIQSLQTDDPNKRDAIQTLLNEVCHNGNRQRDSAAAMNCLPVATDWGRAATFSSNETIRDQQAELLQSRGTDFMPGPLPEKQPTDARLTLTDLEAFRRNTRTAQVISNKQSSYTGNHPVPRSSMASLASHEVLDTGQPVFDPNTDFEPLSARSYITGNQETTSFHLSSASCETGLNLGESAPENLGQNNLQLSEQDMASLDVVDW